MKLPSWEGNKDKTCTVAAENGAGERERERERKRERGGGVGGGTKREGGEGGAVTGCVPSSHPEDASSKNVVLIVKHGCYVEPEDVLTCWSFVGETAIAPEANAGLSGPQLQRAYYDSTRRMIDECKGILEVESSDPSLADKLQAFKTDANAWVGDYRRLVGPRQKSYAETYGAHPQRFKVEWQ
jgi:hypothetical protein